MISPAETSEGPFPLEVWRYEKSLNSRGSHFDGRRFFNPSGPRLQPWTAVPRMLRERRTRWPSRVAMTARTVPARESSAAAVVTFIGHATFLIQTRRRKHPDRSHVFGACRSLEPARAAPCPASRRSVRSAPAHRDRAREPQSLRSPRSPDARLRLAEKFDPIAITPLGNARLLRSTGLRRVEELDWWDRSSTSPLPIALTPAHHFSARGPLRSESRALGWIRHRGRRAEYLFRRRFGIHAGVRRGPAALRADRSRAPSDWRL